MLTSRDISILRHVEQYGLITIQQAYKLYFNNAKYGLDLARKRLKYLAEAGELKYTSLKNSITREYVFYTGRAPSIHKLYLMNFYANLKFHGADIELFEREAAFGDTRADGSCIFKYKGNIMFYLIEVAITNQPDYSKYEILKASEKLQREFGAFPFVLLISDHPLKYRGSKLSVKYLSFDMLDFCQVVLP